MDMYIRVDGQNFDNTIDDTDELSTLRGGGLALLYAPQKLFEYLANDGFKGLEPVYNGASEGLARMPLPDDEDIDGFSSGLKEAAEKFLAGLSGPDDDPGKKIRPFLNFSVAVLPEGKKFQTVNNKLASQNRTAQLQSLTLDCLPNFEDFQDNPKDQKDPPPGPLPCKYDHVRPARSWVEKGPDHKVQVSHSVYVRQRYGRKLRQQFYAQELESSQAQWDTDKDILSKILARNKDVRFADSLDEIALPPGEQKVPQKLKNKMAVLYLDGNNFGKIRIEHCETPEALTSFSEFVLERRRLILAKVVEEVCGVRYSRDKKTVIPMETLLWAGDEMIWVMPAWSALKVLEKIEPMLNSGWGWQKPGANEPIKLSHALGLVICHHKTPIRQVRRLANELADKTKELEDEKENVIGRNACHLQYMVIMGVDPPDQELDEYRERYYGIKDAVAFTLSFQKPEESDTARSPGSFYSTALGMIRAFKGTREHGEAVPLSQLYELRRLAIEGNVMGCTADEDAYKGWLDKADKILGNYEGPDKKPFRWQDLEKANLCYGSQHPVMPLFHILDLWDFLDPFAT